MENHKAKSREILNYFANNQATQHYKVIIGFFHYKGFGVDKDLDMAFKWYTHASQHNVINGYYHVGRCYHYGYGIKKDLKKAFKFYQIAANNGCNIALYYLANFYEYGYGIQKNNFKAYELYKNSAKNGFIPSQYSLAICYEYGIDTLDNQVPVNKGKALKWYKLYQENDGIHKVSEYISNIKKELVSIYFFYFVYLNFNMNYLLINYIYSDRNNKKKPYIKRLIYNLLVNFFV